MVATAVQHTLYTPVTLADFRGSHGVWSTNRHFYLTKQSDEGTGHTAECVVEAPTIAGMGAGTLADFGRARFSSCLASGPGDKVYNWDGVVEPANWKPVLLTMSIDGEVKSPLFSSAQGVSCASVSFCMAWGNRCVEFSWLGQASAAGALPGGPGGGRVC
jgi:hypothetical protein